MYVPFIWLFLGFLALDARAAEQTTTVSAAAPEGESRAVMTAEQVVQMLDETVDWYRTLGTQQQEATQPSELLIVYANRQTADRVMSLAFEIARANAELISSAAEAAKAKDANSQVQLLLQSTKQLDEQRGAGRH